MSLPTAHYVAIAFGIAAAMFAAYGLHITYSAIEFSKVPGMESYNLLSIVLIFRGCGWILCGVISAIFCSTFARLGGERRA